MIVTKKLKCLEKIVSTDGLRAVLTGIHYVPVKHMFEATNSQILIRYYPGKEFDMEDYPMAHMPFEYKPFEEDCIISPDVFDVLKNIKSNKTKAIVDGTMVLSDRDDGSVATFTNGIQMPTTAFPRKIMGMYPKTDPVFPNGNEFVVRKTFGYKEFIKLLSAIKEIANPVTGAFYIDIPVSNKPAIIGCENSCTGDKLEGLIMPQSGYEDDKNLNSLKVVYVVTVFYNGGEIHTYDNPFKSQYEAATFANDKCKAMKDEENKIVAYKVSAKVNGEYTVMQWPPKVEDPEPAPVPDPDGVSDDEKPLTPEEEEALNELTDGDCCSDSAEDTMDKCQEADDSIDPDKELNDPNPAFTEALIEGTSSKPTFYSMPKVDEVEEDPFPNNGKKWTVIDEEKLEFLWKAGKTIEDLSAIFGRKEKNIEKRLEKMGLIEGTKEPFFSEGGYEPPKKEEPAIVEAVKVLKVTGYLKSSYFNSKDKMIYSFKTDFIWPLNPDTQGQLLEKLRKHCEIKAASYGIDIENDLTVCESGKESENDLHIIFNNGCFRMVEERNNKTKEPLAPEENEIFKEEN